MTFREADQSIAAAEWLIRNWDAANREGQFGCAINIALHRRSMSAFRSFLYGDGMMVAGRLQDASNKILLDKQNGIFVSGALRDALLNDNWLNRLQPVALDLPDAPIFA